MFVFFPQRQLQLFIFLRNIRALIQIVPEIQFVIVTKIAQMQVEHFLCESLFRIPFIK